MPKKDPKKAAKAATDKLKNSPAGKAISGVFSKIKAKTGVDKKKVNEWQKKWLAMPKNRTKYDNMKDAPKVVGEEMFAITNDIIDFAKGEHGKQSHIFSKMKEAVEEGKKKAAEVKKAANKAKGAATKGGKGGGVHKKLDEIIEKAKSGFTKAKERAKDGMAEAKKRAKEAKK